MRQSQCLEYTKIKYSNSAYNQYSNKLLIEAQMKHFKKCIYALLLQERKMYWQNQNQTKLTSNLHCLYKKCMSTRWDLTTQKRARSFIQQAHVKLQLSTKSYTESHLSLRQKHNLISDPLMFVDMHVMFSITLLYSCMLITILFIFI